mmetsp:Transcript_68826/g.128448  ORF Transcript_68826/g.128448 Transcript_68826/m.128448 type:complete len:219 (-) Transcript_68826:51-707(-)
MGNGPQCAVCCVPGEDKLVDKPQVKKAEGSGDGYSLTTTALAEDFVGTEHDPLAATPLEAESANQTTPEFVATAVEPVEEAAPTAAEEASEAVPVQEEPSPPSREPQEKAPPTISIEEEEKPTESVEEAFMIVVKKTAGAKLGMDLSHRSTHLGVRKIYKGYAVALANEENAGKGAPTLQEGDLIMTANGVGGSDQEMLKVCRNATEVEFSCRRPTAK